MRTMNYLTLIALMFFTASCSTPDAAKNEELIGTNARSSSNPETEVAELYLHQNYLKGYLGYLEAEKERLMALIEEGDREAIALLEETQREQETSRELYAFNEELMAGLRLPRLPRPLPNPCGVPDKVLNCPAAHFTGDVLALLAADSSRNVTAVLQDTRGRTTAKVSSIEPHETISGVTVHTLEYSNDEGILVISKQNPINGELLSYGIHFVRE